MHTITLKKQSTSHVFSHIYEHIYAIALDTLLRDDGFVPIIDYDIDATTDSGVVSIELESYTDDDLSGYVQRVNTDRTIVDEYVDTAIAQVESEKHRRIEIDDVQKLREEFIEFHQALWGDTRFEVRSEIRIGEGIEPIVAGVRAPYPELQPEVLALYRLVMGVSLNAVLNDLADSYAGFVESTAFAVNGAGELEMSIALHPDVDVRGIESVAEHSLGELVAAESMERLLGALQDVTAMDFPPSQTFRYKDMVIEMNPDAWRRVATAHNLQTIKEVGRIVVEQ